MKPKKKILEKDVKAAIKDLLDKMAIWNFPLTAGIGSYRGLPDRMAIYCNKVYAIEIKRPGGHQSPRQRDFQKLWEQNYGKTYILAFSVDDVINGMGLRKWFIQ